MKNSTRLAAFALALTPMFAQAAVGPNSAQKFQKKQTVSQRPASSPAGSNIKHPGTLPTGVSPMPVKNAPVAVVPAVAATKPAAQIKALNAAEAPKPKVVNEAHAPTLTPVPPTTPATNPGQ